MRIETRICSGCSSAGILPGWRRCGDQLDQPAQRRLRSREFGL